MSCHLVKVIKFPRKHHEVCLKDYKSEGNECGHEAWSRERDGYVVKQQLCGPLSLDPLPYANIRVALSF